MSTGARHHPRTPCQQGLSLTMEPRSTPAANQGVRSSDGAHGSTQIPEGRTAALSWTARQCEFHRSAIDAGLPEC